MTLNSAFRIFYCVVVVISTCVYSYAQDISIYPVPTELTLIEKDPGLSAEAVIPLTKLVLPAAQLAGRTSDIRVPFSINSAIDSLYFIAGHEASFSEQEYELLVKHNSIYITSGGAAGYFYALQTLKQLSHSSQLTEGAIHIKDKPAIARRGFMLDISRDKVPSMKSLYKLIDLLASLKYNELQLYTEHTFAYKNHREVWEGSGAMTPEQIKALDAYCKARFIDLVPNQNSFGHMERWLEHDSYLDLAECPDDCNTAWGLRKRHSLDPTNPQSLDLMSSLYEELLPNFSSTYFNIGCDETIELGHGRSAAACQELGKGRVYLNYLTQLIEAARKHGKKVQFWGDIILNHPELIEEIPPDVTALIWGYGADYPFDEKLEVFSQNKIDFYVCPGTSSWRSLIGRNTNAFNNIRNAVEQAISHGAKGMLLTDWGDHGHWQPFSVSIPSIITAASLSWNPEKDPEPGLASWMNRHVFEDSSEHLGEALLLLGNAYTHSGLPPGNANVFHLMLRRHAWTLEGQYQTREMTRDGLLASDKAIKNALEVLTRATPASPAGKLAQKELNLAANMAQHGIALGLERLQTDDGQTLSIAEDTREKLASELESLIAQYRLLWLESNRTGGLSDSVEKLEDIVSYYRKGTE